MTKVGKAILVYGAGEAAKLFFGNCSLRVKNSIVGFIDDDETICGGQLFGLPIFSFGEIFKAEAYKSMKVDTVILALPSQNLMDKIDTISQIPTSLHLYSMNSIKSLAGRKSDFEDLIYINNQFQKPEFKSENALIYNNIFFKNKTILVTGAGGSIGAEVCEQLMSKGIKKLVALDISEFNLFHLNRSLTEHSNFNEQTHMSLGSVTDKTAVEQLFSDNKIDCIIHCAAYKHVHILEENPSSALINNVLGTYVIASAAARHAAEKFILISTDKAVNPTSIMGASKRLCEKLIYEFNKQDIFCKFALVRFGNVLGSSGSVIPIFEKQAESGNPVTVTHPHVTRFFMSIREAVTLILCAQEIAQGGEAFVLNMGKPKKIVDLAELIIKLSGKNPVYGKASKHLSEIEIKFIGLQPGEKLNEELSKSGNFHETKIPDVMIDIQSPENNQKFLEEIHIYSDTKNRSWSLDAEAKLFIEKWKN